jgi:simple sugar transport system permease protein
MNPAITGAIFASAIRYSTPLILGALCGLLGERSGVMNIGIEGQMLFAAFTGFIVNVYTGNLFLAVLSGVLLGAISGLFLAFMSVTLRIDQIVAGSVINILAIGLTGYLFKPGLATSGKLKPISFGLLKKIPFIGPVLFNSPPITLISILLVFIFHYALFYTRWGLRSRAVGEHPRAADSLGISVFVTRYMNLILGGAVAGLAGSFLTLEAVGSFERGMTNGRGFVALAIMIFGKWTPLGTWGAALLFGLAIAIQTQLQFEGFLNVPHQFISMLPYLLTIIVLALFIGRVRPPASIGTPYSKE